jgi:methyltransferase
MNVAMLHALPLRSAVLLATAAAQRLAELALSRRHIAHLRGAPGRGAGASSADDLPRAAGSRADWHAMIAVHVALLALPAIEVAWTGVAASAAQFVACAAAYGAAQALRYWAIASLGRAWNARAIVDPRGACVASGPYRWIRHPNYLAVLVEFSAIPLALGAWRAWIVLNLAHAPVLVRRIRAEERLLAGVPGYAERMHGKPRFIPGFLPRSRADA